MSVTTSRDGAEGRPLPLALLTELREVDHWRRLVAARIDLAVAAVAAVDEPVVRNLPAAPPVPFGLRELVGLAPPGCAHGEVGTLVRLRAVQRDLDSYARALRTATRTATHDATPDATPDASGRLPDGAGTSRGPGVPEAGPAAPVILLDARWRRRRGPDGVA